VSTNWAACRAAARDQRTSPAVASARISELEKHLGVRLFNRTTRNLQPTENWGRIFYEGALGILRPSEEAEGAVADVPRRTRAGCCSWRRRWAWGGGSSRRMCRRSRRCLYPMIDLRLRLSDRIIDVTAEGLDMAFHLGVLDDSNAEGADDRRLPAAAVRCTRLCRAARDAGRRRGAGARPARLPEPAVSGRQGVSVDLADPGRPAAVRNHRAVRIR
jgi:DNA-binding transcriptional LysR family regulator